MMVLVSGIIFITDFKLILIQIIALGEELLVATILIAERIVKFFFQKIPKLNSYKN